MVSAFNLACEAQIAAIGQFLGELRLNKIFLLGGILQSCFQNVGFVLRKDFGSLKDLGLVQQPHLAEVRCHDD